VNAQVTVTSRATGLSREEVADSDGLYSVVGLEPGLYNTKVKAPGFKTVEQVGVTLNVGGSVRLNFTLEPGQVTETVTVQAEVGLQSETGEVANLIAGKQ